MKDISFDIEFVGKAHIDARSRAWTVNRECGNTETVDHSSLVTQGLIIDSKVLRSSYRRAATQMIHQNKSGERV